MGRNPRFRHPALVVLVLIVIALIAGPVRTALTFPREVRLLPGEVFDLPGGSLLNVRDPENSGWIEESAGGLSALVARELGELNLEVRLLGVRVRSVNVQVTPEVRVIPGGQAIGVLLSAQGLVVSQTRPLVGVDGREYNPARDADIRRGDVIVEMAGQTIRHVSQVAAIVDAYGRRGLPIPVTILRNGVRLQRHLMPVPVEEMIDSRPRPAYKVGLILETPAAGVGTLTFYDPAQKQYGALGHVIADAHNRHIDVGDGRIVAAEIKGIQPGVRGVPGEKIGVFEDDRDVFGTIHVNSVHGIFGTLTAAPPGGFSDRPIPVAYAHHVRTGPAQILTVISGRRVERFEVRITGVYPDRKENGKGLVIQITDPVLMARTGGIVQGMSGSPIIQNGRLVGAVTHVFVNDPTRGYGVLAEWMLERAGLVPVPERSLRQPAVLAP